MPDALHTEASIQLRNIDGSPSLARINLDAQGQVPGVYEEQFRSYAEEAKTSCPVSRALARIPEIVLTARLV